MTIAAAARLAGESNIIERPPGDAAHSAPHGLSREVPTIGWNDLVATTTAALSVRRLLRRASYVLGAGLMVAVWVLFFWRGPAITDSPTWRQLSPGDRMTAISQFRSMLAQVALGVGALGALTFTARNFQLSREGQVADRYSRAVEQLGSDKVDVRLGGIFALERIMIDSSRDHDTVVHLLSTFVSERAPLSDEDTSGFTSTIRWLEPPSPSRISAIHSSRPPADIRAVLAVLGRRPDRAEREPLNLSSTALRGASELRGARLCGIDLTGADLREATLDEADMRDCHLNDADLRAAVLRSANLRSADLQGADLRQSVLFHADLRGANLVGVRLEGAYLDHAALSRAKLDGAHFEGADLRKVTGLERAQIQTALTDGRTRYPLYLGMDPP